ncbi:MAG: hypothetical protein Q8R36_01010 [bacterium]|nr:hypothetical protein [bacterium]
MRRVLVESPYKAETLEDLARNIRYARLCLHDCVLRGDAPIASHLLLTQPDVLRDGVPEERALGIEAGLVWGKEAEVTLVYIDLGITDGMKKGIKRAEDEGRAVEERKLPKELMTIIEHPDPTLFEMYIHSIRVEQFLRSFEQHKTEAGRKYKNLIQAAIEVRARASTFKTAVGAAVETSDGKIFCGANVENLTRSLDSHAEKNAINQALFAGYSGEKIIALALVYVTRADNHSFPGCALCRQYMWENMHPDTLVINVTSDGTVMSAIPLRVLYPLPYPSRIPERVKEINV